MAETSPIAIELLPYHHALQEFLQSEDPEVWQWFKQDAAQGEWVEAQRFELLKATYRVDRESQAELYQAADQVAAKLGIDAPLTIYQAQQALDLNASLAYLPGEVHVVLHGPIAERLEEIERRALLGHELTHYVLLDRFEGQVRIMDRMLAALTCDRAAHSAHHASMRLLLLYNEILCDRGAYQVTGDLPAVVSMLLKVHTGIQQVNPAAFLKQADEIFSRGAISSTHIDHPEAFIRARAIRLWSEQGAESNAAIAEMIEGKPGIDSLDLLQQRQVANDTRRLLDQLFSRSWFHTELTLGHAKLFFPDYKPPRDKKARSRSSHTPLEPPASDSLPALAIRTEPESLADYFAFVLVDFMATDRDLDEPALALALTVAEQIGIRSRFVERARRELKLRKTQLDRIERNTEKLLADADQEAAKS